MSQSSGASQRASPTLPSGTVTFLFTDIEGSTQRWESHRAEMESAVSRHDALLRTAVAAHGGVVFKTVGDAVCAAFARPQDALAGAVDAQRALDTEDFGAVGGLRIRMAVHTGTAQERDGDYFGPTVNRVARLLAIGHGGQVLVSGATAQLLHGVMPPQTSLRDLGEHQLRDLARPEQVHQLAAPGLGEIFPTLHSLETLPNNLPRQATAFVGREHELTELKALLGKSQVVTIVGTGGIGKTRAALQVGADMLDGTGDGVWLVDLAQVVNDELVTSAIASVFELQPQPERKPLDDLCLYLKVKRLLLILDNCEHVVAEATRVVAAIVRACPNVVVLATSREALNVHGEQVYRMPTLSLPAHNGVLSAKDALTYGAIALFVARASALDAQFTFTDEKAPVVADICRRLDGIALAIELAAARVTILNLKQLSQKLDERFRLLTGGDRTALPRQQTMRAAIDWSYELLSEDERTVFRRLSLFQGGWTLEAASALCTDASLDEFAILDILTSLVNKSLVSVEFLADTQRYKLLESLRQYGLDLLRSGGEFDALARRHADFYAAHSRQVAKTWQTIPEVAWTALVERELDNVRAALQWCLDQGNDRELGAEIAEGLWAYGFAHRRLEGLHWLDVSRDAITPESNPALSVALDLALSRLLIGRSWSEAFSAIERALSGAQALNDERLLTRAVFYFGEAQIFAGKFNEAEPAMLKTVELAKKLGDRYREAAALHQLGKIYTERKELARARQQFAAAKSYYAPRGGDRNYGLGLIEESFMERAGGDLERALALTDEATTMGRTIGDSALESFGLAAKAAHLVVASRIEEARDAARESLLLSRREEVFGPGFMRALPACIAIATHAKSFEESARLLGYLLAVNPDRLPATAMKTLDVSWVRQPLRDQLGEEHLQALMAEGAAWSQEQFMEHELAAVS
ncbi:MAG: adenylate/guanylate cyclase domain-containing protein [Candidatus Eremiobacteraeota bacterium]|nr:adenylate/guanylate cyclase domain-containing protein [Candidatus Eremiobacteraeota bacterium]